jgi:hypothetical protein
MLRAQMMLLGMPAMLLAGCVSQKTLGATTPTPPGDTFTCITRQLSSAGYIVQDADRDAGFIKAEKSRSSGFGAALAGAEYFTEMVFNIIPTEAGGSEIKLLVSRTKQESGQQRTTAGMQLQGEDEQDANAITSACGVATEMSAPS